MTASAASAGVMLDVSICLMPIPLAQSSIRVFTDTRFRMLETLKIEKGRYLVDKLPHGSFGRPVPLHHPLNHGARVAGQIHGGNVCFEMLY